MIDVAQENISQSTNQRSRFSELFCSNSALLPGAAYERDPTVDYEIHKAVLYTMASCHSLRSIDGELVGDPLDLKMFGFTDWSFTEGSHDPFSGQLEEPTGQGYSTISPPAGLRFDIDEEHESANVSLLMTATVMYPLRVVERRDPIEHHQGV